MTFTDRPIPTSTSPQPLGRRPSRWLLAVGLAAVMLVAVGVGIAVFRANNSSSTGTVANQQLASVQQSCQQWSGSVAPTPGNASASAWCSTMTDWMSQQLHNGRMTGPMMWGSATTLQSTCRQWMATRTGSTTAGTPPPEWCGEMAGWMAQHVGNWGNWMMNGNMMGH